MTFKIVWSDRALKDMKRVGKVDRKRIQAKVERLSDDPYIGSRLVDSPFFYIRVGKYRVIYDVRGYALEILVVTVGKRDIVYKNI